MSFTPMAHHTCFTRLISDMLLCPPKVKVKAGEYLLPIAAIQKGEMPYQKHGEK